MEEDSHKRKLEESPASSSSPSAVEKKQRLSSPDATANDVVPGIHLPYSDSDDEAAVKPEENNAEAADEAADKAAQNSWMPDEVPEVKPKENGTGDGGGGDAAPVAGPAAGDGIGSDEINRVGGGKINGERGGGEGVQDGGDAREGEEEEEEAAPARRNRQMEMRRDCPYLDTVNCQVPLFNILKKFDGESVTEVVRPSIARMRYRVTRLPKYMILHMRRFTKNNFFMEKNPTLVNFPVKNLELKDYIPLPVPKDNKRLGSKYDLIANMVHDGKPGEGCYRVFVQRKSEELWYEMQDLHVIETLPQMVALLEAYMQIYEQQK